GPRAKAAVPLLQERLKQEDDSELRDLLLDALGAIGPEARPALPLIKEALKDDDPVTRCSAAYALWRVDKDASCIDLFAEALADEDHVGRERSAWALGVMGPPAKSALPALTKTLKDTSALARLCSAQALWRIDRQKDALPVLLDSLKEVTPLG